MDLSIEHNLLRLLNRSFMVLVPEKQMMIPKESKLTIYTPEYGRMGMANCQSVFSVHLNDVRVMMMLMTDGDAAVIGRLTAEYRLMKLDMVQCCALTFVRRFDAPFQKMIEKETVRAGLNFSFQPTLNF